MIYDASMTANLPDKKETILQAARFAVHRIEINQHDASGQVVGQAAREIVQPADAVVIVPIVEALDTLSETSDPTIALIKNERFAVGQTLWEIPAGTIEQGENPDDCAARELAEETGYQAKQIRRITEWFPTPGFCTEYQYVYLASDLMHVGQDLDATERITVELKPMSEALRMVRDGRIKDAKTIAGLLFVQAFCR